MIKNKGLKMNKTFTTVAATSILSASLFTGCMEAPEAPADDIESVITPVAVTFTGTPFGSPDNLINGSGLSDDELLEDKTHGELADHHFSTPRADILSNPLDFDLGGSNDLSEIIIWNYASVHAFYIDRDVTMIDVSLSNDGIDYTYATTLNVVASSGEVENAQVFSLIGTASHVRLQVTSIHGADVHGAEGAFGEVRFR